jgi:hypothetical protein
MFDKLFLQFFIFKKGAFGSAQAEGTQQERKEERSVAFRFVSL